MCICLLKLGFGLDLYMVKTQVVHQLTQQNNRCKRSGYIGQCLLRCSLSKRLQNKTAEHVLNGVYV